MTNAKNASGELAGLRRSNAISNVAELAQAVASRYGVRTSLLSGLYPSVPVRDRVAMIASSDVLFTQGGGDAMIAVFLPTASAMVMPWRNRINTSRFAPVSTPG